MEQLEGDDEYFTPMTQSKKEELLRLESAGKTPRRVKVYLLKGEDWIDNGTGFFLGEIDKDTKVPYFLVRKEANMKEVILKSNLEGSIQYQRQQDTLIVWTDPSGSDLALSFQESEGCADLCDFIIKVQQGNYSPHISLYYVISKLPDSEDITELVTGPIRYPPALPNEENLERVLDILNQGTSSQFGRTNILDYLVESNYFDKLMKIFENAESTDNIVALKHLSGIARILLSYNEPTLLEEMLSSEKNIHILAGMLEYDSSDSGPKHRTLFKDMLFKTVIPIDEIDLFKRDYSLSILKDLILVKYSDDESQSHLNSLIYTSQLKILNCLRSAGILEKLFEIYESEASVDLRRDGIKMLHQYVQTAKSIQKQDFFALLVRPGLFSMVNFALTDSEIEIRNVGTELIVNIIEQNVALTTSEDQERAIDNSEPPVQPSLGETTPIEPDDDDLVAQVGVTVSNSQLNSFSKEFFSILANILTNDEHLGLKYQAFEALKTLLDPNVLGSSITSEEGVDRVEQREVKEEEGDVYLNLKYGIGANKDDSYDAEKFDHLTFFYTKVAPKLFAKVTAMSNSTEAIESVSRTDSALFLLLCELAIFGLREHDVGLVKSFLTEYRVIDGIVKLLNSKCKKVLKLHVVRCLRSIVLLNDDGLTNYLLENDILRALFFYFESVAAQNDMCNSACLDFLNHIRIQSDAKNYRKRSNFKQIARYLSKHHGNLLQSVTCMKIGPTIAALVANDFYETESASLGICGETNLEQLGIHESFIGNGFSCRKDIDKLNPGTTSTLAVESLGGSLLEVRSRRGEHTKPENEAQSDPDGGSKDDPVLTSTDSKAGEKRPRDLHQPIDSTLKKRNYADIEKVNGPLDESVAVNSSASHVRSLTPKDILQSESSANKEEFKNVQRRLVEASGRGTHDS